MDTFDSESESLGKRVVRPPRTRSAEEWEEVLSAFAKSGLTQKAFAQREGINFHTLVDRLKQRRRMARVSQEKPEEIRFQELSLAPAFTSVLEVQSPDGWVLKGGSPKDLAELVKLCGR